MNWATHVYIDDRQKKQWRELEQSLKDISVGLFFETQEHEAESLVMWIITHGELVQESRTYRPYAMEIIKSRSYKVSSNLIETSLTLIISLDIRLALYTISF